MDIENRIKAIEGILLRMLEREMEKPEIAYNHFGDQIGIYAGPSSMAADYEYLRVLRDAGDKD